jgi:LacI family transcriptional regulator
MEKRMSGFCKACMNRGIEVRPEWLVSGEYHNPAVTYERTKKLLVAKERPTCIFMPDDYSAIGGYNAIADCGLKIPNDVSVVGYDGIAYAEFLTPKLVTYRQDTAEIGSKAAQKLIGLIENPSMTFTEVISVDGMLLSGDSVANLNAES